MSLMPSWKNKDLRRHNLPLFLYVPLGPLFKSKEKRDVTNLTIPFSLAFSRANISIPKIDEDTTMLKAPPN